MRSLPATPKLSRRVNVIAPKVSIVIACEGQSTEPEYFLDCVNHYGAGLVHLRVLPRHGVPLTVVKAAVQEKLRLQEVARREKKAGVQTFPFRVWAVFDQDDHDVAPAMALAEQNGIDVALSNPCFELWPLLHYEHYANFGEIAHRHVLQRRLNALMPSFDHDAGAIVDFNSIKDGFELAHARAAFLNRSRQQEGIPYGCPSTTVCVLVKKIIENGKYVFRK